MCGNGKIRGREIVKIKIEGRMGEGWGGCM